MGVIVRQKIKGKGQPWWVFASHNGKRTSRKVGDKKAADAVASEIRKKLKLGDLGFLEKKKPVQSFKDFAKGFMKTYSAMNHKASTHTSYRSALDMHINPYFGDMSLDKIARKDIKGFINLKLSEGLAPGTVRNLRAYVSGILSDAVDDEIIAANPASRTGRHIKDNEQKEEINPLSWEEKAVFEETTKNHYPKYYPFFLTALRTGLRLGEMIALKPGDVDLRGGFLEVRRSFTKGKMTTPKSPHMGRVDMSSGLVEVMRA